MCLFWGVIPVSFSEPQDHQAELETAISAVAEKMEVEPGSRCIVTGGLNVRTPGSTSVMEIRELA